MDCSMIQGVHSNVENEPISSARRKTSVGINRRTCRRCVKQIFTFVTFLSTMVHVDARGHGMVHVQSKNRGNYEASNDKAIESKHEKLYKGRSGDPWASHALENNENIYMRLPPYLNTTFNDTKSNQLPTVTGKEFPSHRRFKRGVVHLYNMVVCATGCNPLAYKGYGCYCGFLGSGYVIDGIDRCCKMHDWCYDATECPMFMEYFVPYYWRCYHGYKPVCAVEHGDWGSAGSCAQRLCECDRSLAECLRRYPCPTTKAVCTSSPWRLVQNLFMIM